MPMPYPRYCLSKAALAAGRVGRVRQWAPRASLPDFDCRDCGVNTRVLEEYYFVRPEIWRQAKGDKRMLCIGCLERRLGRRLGQRDFASSSLDGTFSASRRLENRLHSRPLIKHWYLRVLVARLSRIK
jgi:hypothetical protein